MPPELMPSIGELLEHHFADAGLTVIADVRSGERRARERRGRPSEAARSLRERRRIHSEHGRRMFDRRALAVEIESPPLPRRVRRYADRIRFVECVSAEGSRSQDVESARLVARFQSGDATAFTQLYQRYFDSVYGYLRVMLRDHHEAEDAAQQTFAKVFQALPAYELRRGVPVRAWIYRIARNEALGHLRKHSRVDVEAPDQLDFRRDAETLYISRESVGSLSDSELMLFIERLPVAQRQALALRYMLGLRTDEVAAALDRTPQAVRKLEHRALRFLEQRLTATGASVAPSRQRLQRVGMLVRIRRARVLGARRFALAFSRTGATARPRRGW